MLSESVLDKPDASESPESLLGRVGLFGSGGGWGPDGRSWFSYILSKDEFFTVSELDSIVLFIRGSELDSGDSRW